MSPPRSMIVLGVEVPTPHEMLRAAGRKLKAEMTETDYFARRLKEMVNETVKNPKGSTLSPEAMEALTKDETFVVPRKTRSCNRHKDCDTADAKVRAKYDAAAPYERAYLPMWAEHCDDETCEDCFGT